LARVVAIVQARMGSTRLPGKVLRPLGGIPMVLHVVRRAARIPGVEAVVVATPDGVEDAPLRAALDEHEVANTAGPADDVLRRYAMAARLASADVVVRITADCPLLSPSVSGGVVDAFLRGDCDYASNTLERSWPRGLDTEILSRETLETVDATATERFEREHVTPAVWQHPERFRLCSVRNDEDLSAIRLTVDTEADFRFIEAILAALPRDDADLDDVLALLAERPELAAINAGVAQKDLHG
jgi:spore coat polysaccharide biosynthesis protein SpsF (cytidylyltransferase family)